MRAQLQRLIMDGEGFAIEGYGLGVDGGGSACIDLDPLFMIGGGSGG